MNRFGICLLLLALAAAGCGTNLPDTQAEVSQALDTRTVAHEPGHPDQNSEQGGAVPANDPLVELLEPEVVDDAPAQPAAAPAAPDPPAAPAGEPESWGGSRGDARLVVSAEPRCVVPGDVVTVTVQTEPEALVAVAMQHADEHGEGDSSSGFADPDGVYTHPYTVEAGLPPGYAVVLASVNDAGTTADGWALFEIVDSREVCP